MLTWRSGKFFFSGYHSGGYRVDVQFAVGVGSCSRFCEGAAILPSLVFIVVEAVGTLLVMHSEVREAPRRVIAWDALTLRNRRVWLCHVWTL